MVHGQVVFNPETLNLLRFVLPLLLSQSSVLPLCLAVPFGGFPLTQRERCVVGWNQCKFAP